MFSVIKSPEDIFGETVIYQMYVTENVIKNVVFWDVALYRSWVNRRFGGTYRLHLQGRKIRENVIVFKTP
jgi:hypothetical protein